MSNATSVYGNLLLTPNGQRVILVASPVHTGLVGGAEVNVSPATVQLIGQAVAVIVSGGSPESKMGDGSFYKSRLLIYTNYKNITTSYL